MSTVTAQQLVRTARMSTRPEYYSGRGAILCDLNGEQLFIIYKGIKENIGEKQAESFVKMIENINSLSATNFLNCLYALEANDWTCIHVEESDIDLGPDTPGRTAVALGTLFGSFSSSRGDSTDYIRNTFFKLIDHPIKQQNPHTYNYWSEYY